MSSNDRTPPYATDDRVEVRFVTYPNGERPWFAGTVTQCVPGWLGPPEGWDIYITVDHPPGDMQPGIVTWLEPDGTNPDVRLLADDKPGHVEIRTATAQPSGRKFNITWTRADTEHGHPAATGYRIQHRKVADGSPTVWQHIDPEKDWQDDDPYIIANGVQLPDAGHHWIRVAALNGDVEGEPSRAVEITVTA